MSELSRIGRPPSGRVGMLVLLTGLLAVALAPSVAGAHTLSEQRATQAARGFSAQLAARSDARRIAGGGALPVERYDVRACRRRGVHRFACEVVNHGRVSFPADGMAFEYECVTPLSVSYRNHRTRRLKVSLAADPDCESAPVG